MRLHVSGHGKRDRIVGITLSGSLRHVLLAPLAHRKAGLALEHLLEERLGIVAAKIGDRTNRLIPVGTHGNFIRRPEAWK